MPIVFGGAVCVTAIYSAWKLRGHTTISLFRARLQTMPRNMSFALTTDQIMSETKTVTRRLGWSNLKRGEKARKLKVLRCLSNTPQRVDWIGIDDVAREGFPDTTPRAFVEMFCRHMKCQPDKIINRIEFEYV